MKKINVIRCILAICLILVGKILTAQKYQPQWKPNNSSEFEVNTQLRAWTIQDEGMETIFENCQMAGINNIYFLSVMHKSLRPFHTDKFPHNPQRSTFFAEDSRVTFFPDMKRYGKIKPFLSDYEWIRNTDWLQLTIDECRKRGFGVGTEISHRPLPKSFLNENPELKQKDIYGKTAKKIRFCPNNPDVREYLLALFGDLAANYDLDYIQTCMYVYSELDIDDGAGCFCKHCIKEAKLHGIDLEAIIPVLQKDKDAEPERSIWMENRARDATELFKDIAEEIRKENPNCHLRLNEFYSELGQDPMKQGMDIEAIGKYLGSLVTQDHTEQLGNENEDFAIRIEWLSSNRTKFGSEKPLLCAIAPRMDATPELVRKGIKAAVQHPAKINGLSLKHYDGASYSLLRAFKQGMIEAGVQGLTPTLGKEVEEMNLEGYKVFNEELAEDWGVETNKKGEASCIFDYPSGKYTIRITYFDEKNGESPVRIYVAGKKVISFNMDENTDCWRWRKFDGIKIKKGDKILLLGEADGEEKAKLDFIEYIPE